MDIHWYYLDDVSVVETAGPTGTPEPASALFLALGIAGLAGVSGLRKRMQTGRRSMPLDAAKLRAQQILRLPYSDAGCCIMNRQSD
jgi:hypothetical protein